MNQNEAVEFLPIIQALADGKPIEVQDCVGSWSVSRDLFFNLPVKCYRIKQDLKYRSFKNKEECLKEMQKHQPFGWVKAYHGQFIITEIKDSKATIGKNDNFMDYDYIFENYTFADGAPFGIKDS